MKTVIVVGVTEVDQYGNLQVTTKEGGVVKVNKKREHLFKLFQQGKAVELDWQTYMDKDYVADARLVEGALPDPVEPPTDMTPPQAPQIKPAPQAEGMCWKEIGELYREGKLKNVFGTENAVNIIKAYRGYLLATLKIPYDGDKLPQYDKEQQKEE